eukprot:tig00021017_g17193.t1
MAREERRRRYEEQRAAVAEARRSQQAAELAEGKELAGRANDSAMGSRAVLEALLRARGRRRPRRTPTRRGSSGTSPPPCAASAAPPPAPRGASAPPRPRPAAPDGWAGPSGRTRRGGGAGAGRGPSGPDLEHYEGRVRRLLMALEERLEHRARAYTGDIMTSTGGAGREQRGEALRGQLAEAQREIGELRRIIGIQAQLVAEMRAADAEGPAGSGGRRGTRRACGPSAASSPAPSAALLEGGGSEAGDVPPSPAHSSHSQSRGYYGRGLHAGPDASGRHSPHNLSAAMRRAHASPAAKTGTAPVVATAAAALGVAAEPEPGGGLRDSSASRRGADRSFDAGSGDERASVASSRASVASSRGGRPGPARPRPASAGGRVRHRPPPLELEAIPQELEGLVPASPVVPPVPDQEMANIRALTQQAHRHGMRVTKVQSQVTRDGQRRLVLYF